MEIIRTQEEIDTYVNYIKIWERVCVCVKTLNFL